MQNRARPHHRLTGFTARRVLPLLLVVPIAWAAEPAAPRAPRPPNVLFIAIDDLRPDIHALGTAAAQTPHLDRLAGQSVSFSRHYAVVPTCGASRYALLTGRSPGQSGVTTGNEGFSHGASALSRQPTSRAQTWPELFRRNHYHTVQIGKISHAPDGRVFAYDGSGAGQPELPGAWDELATPTGPWQRGWGAFFAYADGQHREDGLGHDALMQFVAEQDEDLPDGLMAASAVTQLHRLAQRDEPFVLAVGFFKPHLPFVATRADWEAMADVDPGTPAFPDAIDSPYWSRSAEFYRYSFPFAKTHPLAPEAALTVRRAYLACIRYVDRQVGKVLDALERENLADNTIVVVWGDHGWHLGELGVWGKHTPFERALRSVLMVRAPGVSRGGTISPALVESTDIYPTLLDLCGLPGDQTEYPLAGTSLRPLLDGTAAAVRDTAVGFWQDGISVRTDTRRLIVRNDPEGLKPLALYDLALTPDEQGDLLPSEPDTVAAMRARLAARLRLLRPDAP